MVTLIAAIGVLWPDVAVPIVVAVALGLLLAVGLLLHARLRRTLDVLRDLRREVALNHKRASQWEWRLNQRLTGFGVPVAAPVVPTAAARSHPWKNHPQAAALIATRAFSLGFYRAASGKKFGQPVDAASHYLTYGMPALLAPNAFVDPAAFPEDVRSAMKHGGVDTFLAHLSSGRAGAFGAAFDPRFVAPGGSASAPGPLGRFMVRLTSDTVLPVPPDSALAGVAALDYGAQVTESTRELRREGRLRASRVQSRWDSGAEEAWKATVRRGPQVSTRVSVVMPVWNRLDYVGAAVASVKAQTHADWQLVVVDDHSTDGTWEFLQALAGSDPRIVALRNRSKGVSSARNVGLSAADGELVAFLDSDNQWRPDYLELMVRAMARDGAPLAYAASHLSGGAGHPSRYMAFEGGRESLLFLNHIDINVLVVRRELADAVGGFDESLKRWVDHDLIIRLSARHDPVLYPFIGCDYEHSMDRDDRITVRESNHWQWVVLGRALLDWEAEDGRERVPGRLSVVIPTYDDHAMTLKAVDSILGAAAHAGEDVEVVVVDNGSAPVHAHALVRGLSARPAVTLVRLPKNYNFAIGCNLGFLRSSGEFVLFLNNDTILRRGSLTGLTAPLADPAVAGVQPVLVYEDDTIQTAGTIWVAPDSLPIHLFTGHPVEDSSSARDAAFSAVTGAAMLLRADDVARTRGFDPFYVNGMEDVDLCLRVLETRPGGFRVDPDVLVTHLESKTPGRGKAISANRQIFMDRWRGRLPAPQQAIVERGGFEVARVGSDGSKAAVLGTRATLIRARTSPRRWGIKNPANAGVRGDGWGDTHFAASLGASLRRQGQDVVTYRHEAHPVEVSAFDDVSLVLRGLDRVRPVPGQVNILWIISHPESVTEEELRGFDLVYAASESWAAQKTAETGIRVRPLLQATDSHRFEYVEPTGTDCDVVFVGGRYPGRERPLITRALEADIDFAVIGPGWKGVIPDSVWRGPYVANEELAGVYRNARFVLADHWADMAAEGFVQNRVFDAVASGCQVLTDPVDGLERVFGSEVTVVQEAADIERAVALARTRQHDDAARQRLSAQVLARHSFDARAEQLIRDVAAA